MCISSLPGRPKTVLLPEWNASVTGIAFTTAEEWEPFAGAAFAGSEAAVRLGVVHGEGTRGESKYRAISPAEIGKTDLTYLALGHVHRYGGVQRAGTTAYAYPGCLPGRGFDETGDKGFLFGDVTAAGRIWSSSPLPGGAIRASPRTSRTGTRRRLSARRWRVTAARTSAGCCLPGPGGRIFPSRRWRELAGLCASLTLTDETYPEEDVWARWGRIPSVGCFCRI